MKLGNLNSLINILTSNITGSGGALIDQGYNPDRLYYLTHLLNYISVDPITRNYGIILNPSNGFPSILSYITVGILILGLGIYLYQIYMKGKIQGIFNSNRFKTYYCSIMLIILLGVGVFSFFTDSFIVTDFIIIIALFFG